MSDQNGTFAPPPAPAGVTPSSDDKLWGMLAHLSALLLGFIGPLVIWLVKKNESQFVDDQGKEALNFQITVFIAMMICAVLSIILIGLLLMPIVGIAALVFSIIGGIKANGGEAYRYPFAIRLIK